MVDISCLTSNSLKVNVMLNFFILEVYLQEVVPRLKMAFIPIFIEFDSTFTILESIKAYVHNFHVKRLQITEVLLLTMLNNKNLQNVFANVCVKITKPQKNVWYSTDFINTAKKFLAVAS
jgi:hypothetical protein